MDYEILNSFSDYVLVIDREQTVLFANRSFIESCALPSNGIIGEKCYELSRHCSQRCTDQSGDSFCPIDCPHKEVLQTGHSTTTCHTHFWANGREQVLQISASPVYGNTGEITGIIQVMRDVTKDKLLETLILDAKREWECAMDVSEDAMYILGENGCLLRANNAFFRMINSTPEGAIGREISQVIHPQGEDIPCPVCRAHKEERDTVIILEADHSGNPVGCPLEVTVRIVRDEQGRSISKFVRLHDLTAQRETERELLRSRDQWERTFNAFTDIVTLQDRDLRIVRVNKQGCEALGLSCDSLIDKHCYEFFHGYNQPCENCPLLVSRETFEPYTTEITHEKLGKTFLVSASPVMDEKGNLEYIAHVAKDITEQKKIEESLYQAQKMEAVGTLAGGIAHDFNNILSSIIGYAEFVQEEIAGDSQAAQDIEQVISSSLRAKELVRQLLDYSRRSPRKPELLSPCPVVREALMMLRSTMPASITIEEDLDSTMGMIMAEPIGLQQIILNLCTNAMHAIDDRKGSITVKLSEIRTHESEIGEECSTGKGPFVVLSVQDTGCGMDRAILDKIFEPYFTTKEPGKGTGMGLAVIHGIVSELDGCIHVQSSPGKGSIFSVYFPVSGVTEPSATSDVRDSGSGPDIPGSARILVVDDEPLIVRVHKRQLEKQGYAVTITTDSREALEMIRARPDAFDLMITDHSMPGLTGVELGEEVMKIKPSLPIILCTGHSGGLSEKQALDSGIRKYISKPVHKNELIDAARKVLEKGA